MTEMLCRSISHEIRTGLSWDNAWRDTDRGLILCWEKGRELRQIQPTLADRALRGELIPLPWKGGVEWRLTKPKKGSLQYLAMWQGLRNEDLAIPMDREIPLTCARTGQVVLYAKHNFTIKGDTTHSRTRAKH